MRLYGEHRAARASLSIWIHALAQQTWRTSARSPARRVPPIVPGAGRGRGAKGRGEALGQGTMRADAVAKF